MNSDTNLRPLYGVNQGFGQVIRFFIAPVALCLSGFHTMDFLLSGVYSWPRTSRVLALTLAVVILTYEFVYKEQQSRTAQGSGSLPLRVVFFSCVIPYMVGSLAIVFLVALSS